MHGFIVWTEKEKENVINPKGKGKRVLAEDDASEQEASPAKRSRRKRSPERFVPWINELVAPRTPIHSPDYNQETVDDYPFDNASAEGSVDPVNDETTLLAEAYCVFIEELGRDLLPREEVMLMKVFAYKFEARFSEEELAAVSSGAGNASGT